VHTSLAEERLFGALSEVTGVNVVWDESSNEAVAKLRAMNEAGNVTWDVVDVVASDAIRLCDEGLARPMDPDTELAAAPDGTSAAEDFGDLLVSECFIPQIVYSTTFGYRSDVAEWNGKEPEDICAVFDTETFPGKRSLEKRPINNMEWALLCDGVAKEDVYDVLETDEGVAQALAKLDTIKDDVIWWSAGAETPQLLADGEVVIGSTYNGRLFSVIEEQKQPVKMLWDAQVFDLDGWIIPEGLPEDRLNRAKHFVKFATDTQRLADQAKYISYGPARASSAPLVQACRTRHRHGAAHADRSGTTRRTPSSTITSGGLITATIWTPSSRLGWLSKPSLKIGCGGPAAASFNTRKAFHEQHDRRHRLPPQYLTTGCAGC
jgi:putative spermidine/putrescine transport system substrate-binding protein